MKLHIRTRALFFCLCLSVWPYTRLDTYILIIGKQQEDNTVYSVSVYRLEVGTLKSISYATCKCICSFFCNP